MAGTIIADTIQATSQQISLNVGNTTILTASSTGLTLIPSNNVNINVTNSTVAFGSGNVTNPSISFSGNTSTGIFMPVANVVAWTTAGAETMRITAAGNFGVGVTSPQARIHSTKAGAELARFTNSGSNGGDWELKIGGGGFEDRKFMIADKYSGADAVRLAIDSTGEVLIGATAASQTADGLFVRGKRTATSNQWNFQVYTTAGQATFSCRDDYYFRSMGIYDRTAGGAANITIDGSGYLYRSTSSIKYKRDVTNYDKGIAEVMQLRPVYYKSKVNDPDGNQINTQFAGLIAEELDEIGLDEFVVKDKDGEVEAIHYGNMVALLTKAIQELKVIVDAQAVEIAALKAK